MLDSKKINRSHRAALNLRDDLAPELVRRSGQLTDVSGFRMKVSTDENIRAVLWIRACDNEGIWPGENMVYGPEFSTQWPLRRMGAGNQMVFSEFNGM